MKLNQDSIRAQEVLKFPPLPLSLGPVTKILCCIEHLEIREGIRKWKEMCMKTEGGKTGNYWGKTGNYWGRKWLEAMGRTISCVEEPGCLYTGYRIQTFPSRIGSKNLSILTLKNIVSKL